MLLSVWLIIMMDYLVTYIGNRAVGIQEANPFMMWLFDFDILPGLFLRAVMALAVCFLLNFIRRHEPKYYTGILVFFYAVMLAVFSMHIYWISYI